jgi:hypothetical protein
MKRLKELFNAIPSPILTILGVVVLVVLLDVCRQFRQPIKIDPDNLHISKRELKQAQKRQEDEIFKTVQKIEIYSSKIDSCKYVLDSIFYRKRSNLDTLQRWYDSY